MSVLQKVYLQEMMVVIKEGIPVLFRRAEWCAEVGHGDVVNISYHAAMPFSQARVHAVR